MLSCYEHIQPHPAAVTAGVELIELLATEESLVHYINRHILHLLVDYKNAIPLYKFDFVYVLIQASPPPFGCRSLGLLLLLLLLL